MDNIELGSTDISKMGCSTKSDTSEKVSPESKPISEAKLCANQQNAKKSTGPKTPRGKANSRFNALRHGLCSRRIIYDGDGNLRDEDLEVLFEDLRDKYGHGDVRTELLLETLVLEYWRAQQAMEQELELLKNGKWHFCPQGNVPQLQRYKTASQNTFFKVLNLLDERLAEWQPEADNSDNSAEPSSKDQPASASTENRRAGSEPPDQVIGGEDREERAQ